MAALDELIAELERSYTETRDRMSDPAVYNDHREAATVGRRLKQLDLYSRPRGYPNRHLWRAFPAGTLASKHLNLPR